MTYPHEVTAVSIFIFLHNHKTDYLLTGYYLHDKQLTDQKAVDSSGSYEVRMCGVVYIVAVSTNHYGSVFPQGQFQTGCLININYLVMKINTFMNIKIFFNNKICRVSGTCIDWVQYYKL